MRNESDNPLYEYQALYEGRIMAAIAFDSAKEARAFYKLQQAGLSPSDPHRAVLRFRGKVVLDTWNPK